MAFRTKRWTMSGTPGVFCVIPDCRFRRIAAKPRVCPDQVHGAEHAGPA